MAIITNKETLEVSTEPTLSEIMAMMKQLQKENAELKKNSPSIKENVEASKKMFDGQLVASYWLYDDVPVLSIKTTKKDSAQPIQYTHPTTWYTINNHYLDVTLANGKTVKLVERDLFEASKVLSPLAPFSVIYVDSDGEETRINKVTSKNIATFDTIKHYVFNVEGYWEILVSNNCIN